MGKSYTADTLVLYIVTQMSGCNKNPVLCSLLAQLSVDLTLRAEPLYRSQPFGKVSTD